MTPILELIKHLGLGIVSVFLFIEICMADIGKTKEFMNLIKEVRNEYPEDSIERKIPISFVATVAATETGNFQFKDAPTAKAANNFFGAVGQSNEAIGIDIDYSGLAVSPGAGSEIVGLRVDVGQQVDTEKRYAALFNNGNVGINVSDPSVELEVSGSIKADALDIESDLSLRGLTINQLTVLDSFYIDATFNVTEVHADIVSANTIEFETIEINNATFYDHITANTLVAREKFQIGDIAEPNAAYVFEGNGDFRVSGNLVVDSLQVSELNFTGIDEVVITGNAVTFANEVSFNQRVTLSDGLGFENIGSKPVDTGRGYIYLSEHQGMD